jgi:mannose-6-phosphate isomerase-like protein (cupin superfamily)
MKHPRDIKRVRYISFRKKNTGNGTLMMCQHERRGLPFDAKKILVVSGMRPSDVRGRHAHRRTDEIVIALNGGCTIEVTDGKHTRIFKVTSNGKGLFLPARLWRVLRNFHRETILLIIANTTYNEKDYIRNYDQFLRSHLS